MRKLTVHLAVLIAVGLSEPAARAACTGSVPVFHGLDSYFACADIRPVSAFAYQISSPTVVNSGSVGILLCEPTDPVTCPYGGIVGDGSVQVETDWGNPGFNGCPVYPNEPQRIAIVVQAADGRGLVASLSGVDPSIRYLVEAAHPYDPSTSEVFPLPCTDRAGAPKVLAQTTTADGHEILYLHFTAPLVYSDCDPGTVGQFIGTCTDNFEPDSRLAGIYSSVQSCTGPASLLRSVWSDTGVKPDATGNATVIVASPPAGSCALIGYTALIGGFESGGIVGFVNVPPSDCPDGDGDGFTLCGGDCNDSNPAVNPAAKEICNGIDDNCNGLVDEGPTGAVDTDGDGVHDACDNCPTIPNPGQDPGACDQRIVNIAIDFSGAGGRGSGVVTWETTHEVDVRGFNVVVNDPQGNPVRQNTAEIPCAACITGPGEHYSFTVPKHKSGRGIFIELVRRNGVVESYGPATRQ